MGTEICCMKTRAEIYPIKLPPKISNGFPHVDDTTIKIIKIQTAIRVYLAKNKLNSVFNKTISEIKKELDKKKLINESIILESESHKIHQRLLSEKKNKSLFIQT